MAALWTATQAAAATGGTVAGDWLADGVSIDTRKVARGDLFVALRGPRFDGHDFVAQALADGAAAAMVERIPDGLERDRLLLVPETMAGLQALAKAARERSGAHIAAVTGSVGKTGTKEALAFVLSRQGATHASAGNLNNHIGLPLSLARLPRDAGYAVFELGMNHAGEIEPLSRLLRPHVAIITTVEAVHIEFFDSVAGIADAKAEIFAGLEPGGTAIVNADNPYFSRLVDHARARGVERMLSFGEAAQAQARLEQLVLGADGSQAKATVLGQEIAFRLSQPGRHHVLNALAVLLAVAALGADVEAAAMALADVAPVAGRGVPIDVTLPGGTFRIVDESYNASPAAVRAALASFALMEPGPGGRRVAVLGDMLELGSSGAALHAELAEAVIAAGVELVFAAGPLMKNLYEALPAARRGAWALDAAKLSAAVAEAVKPGDVVLVKGSAGSKMGHVVSTLRALAQNANEARHAV